MFPNGLWVLLFPLFISWLPTTRPESLRFNIPDPERRPSTAPSSLFLAEASQNDFVTITFGWPLIDAPSDSLLRQIFTKTVFIIKSLPEGSSLNLSSLFVNHSSSQISSPGSTNITFGMTSYPGDLTSLRFAMILRSYVAVFQELVGFPALQIYFNNSLTPLNFIWDICEYKSCTATYADITQVINTTFLQYYDSRCEFFPEKQSLLNCQSTTGCRKCFIPEYEHTNQMIDPVTGYSLPICPLCVYSKNRIRWQRSFHPITDCNGSILWPQNHPFNLPDAGYQACAGAGWP